MVDAPVAERARVVLALAKELDAGKKAARRE